MADLFVASFDGDLPAGVVALRLGAACVLSVIVGLDRESRRHPPGLRTHMLMALGAALLTLIGLEFVAAFAAGAETRLDPVRILSAVAPAVAILAAATIFHTPRSVKGVTTGVSLWLSGAVGIACGAGFLTHAVFAVVLAMGILIPARAAERRLFRKQRGRTDTPG